MKPYYSHGGIQIFHGDCLDILPSLSADLVITDPPYGVSGAVLNPNRNNPQPSRANQNDWHAESTWDAEIDPSWPKACADCCDIVAWFGNWKRRQMVSDAIGIPIRAEIIWAKDTHVGPPCPLAMQDERIWIFSTKGVKARCFDTTVWSEPIIPTWSHKHHKNEKPIGLMRRLVRLLSDEGQAVLDPFMGSGTTLRAAKDLGRRAIGIDLDEQHCETAARRLDQEVLF